MKRLIALSCFAVAAAFATTPANALTMKECSAKYQAAKDADTLDGQTWAQFRKAECGSDDSAAQEPEETQPKKKAAAKKTDDATQEAGLTSKECSAKYQAAKDADALNGMKWNDFRKAECGPGASPTFTAKRAKAAKTNEASASAGLSMKECSARYQAAKASNSLKGMKWNDFRKSSCGADASDDDSVPSFDEASYDREPEAPVTRAPRGVTFPKGLARKFFSETPAKARMHSCLEEYYNNKDAGTLNGLRWIQKGGGYYSLCNARLKGNS